MSTKGSPSGISQLGGEGSGWVARWEEDDEWGEKSVRRRRGSASKGWDDSDDWEDPDDWDEDDDDDDDDDEDDEESDSDDE